MTTEMSYNGWTNYNTWRLALVLGNNEQIDAWTRELVSDIIDEYIDIYWIDNFKESLEDEAIRFIDEDKFVYVVDCEIFDNVSWSEIDWHSIFETFKH